MENPSKAEKAPIRKQEKTGLFQKATRIGISAALIGIFAACDNEKTTLSPETVTPPPATETVENLPTATLPLIDTTPVETVAPPTPEPTVTSTQELTPTKTPELSEKDLTKQFFEEMKLKYGIDIKIGTVFFDVKDPSSEFAARYKLDEQPKDYLSKAEINAFRDALGTIPFCPQLVDEIYIRRFPSEKNPQNDFAYIGGGHQSIEVKGAKDFIFFNLSNNLDLTVPTLENSKVGIKTYKELLEKVFFHECGHLISNMVLSAAYPEDEYFQIMYPGRVERDYLRDKKNPLFIAFSQLEGWEKTPNFDQDFPKDYVYIKQNPDSRLAYYATNVKIEEHFAELWGLYIANSPILTDQENKFFQKIYDGLKTNPQEFSKKVAQNPMILLVD